MALRGSARIPVLAAMSALALTLAGPETASAQTAGGSNHVPAIAKLPNSAIAQFQANPQGLLATYASGGLALSARARSLVLTDPSLVNVLIEVAKNGNDAQKRPSARAWPKRRVYWPSSIRSWQRKSNWRSRSPVRNR